MDLKKCLKVLQRTTAILVVLGGLLGFGACLYFARHHNPEVDMKVFTISLGLIILGGAVNIITLPLLIMIYPPPKQETDQERVSRVHQQYGAYLSGMKHLVSGVGIAVRDGKPVLSINVPNAEAEKTLREMIRNEIDGVPVVYMLRPAIPVADDELGAKC